MRVLNRFLSLLSLVALSAVVSGCGQDFVGKISCTSDAQCLAAAGTLFGNLDASSPDFFPLCCSGTCVLPAGGCDIQASDGRGYRYLDNDPGYGSCVTEDPMCPIPPDLATPVFPDLSSSNSD